VIKKGKASLWISVRENSCFEYKTYEVIVDEKGKQHHCTFSAPEWDTSEEGMIDFNVSPDGKILGFEFVGYL
jgi:hypothetical protein